MKAGADTYNPGLEEGDRICGYTIQRIVPLDEIRSVFYALVHAATGTRHIHISNQDAENTFGVAFKTVPMDSTGVAHILEHTALCGSNHYPVRDPFFSMLKRSLSTFMNAFTASDWTMYPFATQNRKDFYNLLAVYVDAAFFPRLDELSFKQEGHRLEIEGPFPRQSPDAVRLVYKGVVYNEMKGAMSSPDQVMVRSLLNALYPATTYSHNSGGDPAVIPSLSHAQLKAFHRRHYHPSNAYFYTYGNLPLKDHLAVIRDTVLNRFERIDPQTDVPSQPRWQSPRAVIYSYPLEKDEDLAQKCQVAVAWLTADIRDSFEVLSLALLEQILMGNSAAPLRKALIDSQLGTALCDGSGFEADNRDTMFVSGLKGVSEADALQIERIMLDVLQDLVAKGIDRQLIESAIHQMEFHRKEITNTPYPYGIKLVLSFAGSWLHGGDPVRSLKFDEDLAQLRAALDQGPFFENQIRKYFLENPHRVRLTLVPDPQKAADEELRVRAELERIRKALSDSDLERINQDAEALRRQQETEEDISCLPTLEREDIPPAVASVPATAADERLPVTYYDQATSGIFYVAAVAGAGNLPPRLIPLVPFFCYAFSKIGTTLRDYAAMAQRIDAYTGGIGLATHCRTRFDEAGACMPFVSLSGKCLRRNQDRMFEIVQELLLHFDFSDLARLKSLLREYRAGLESTIIHNGHRLAISLAARNFSPARHLSETWGGIHQLQTIKRLTDDLAEEQLGALSQDLAAIAQVLFTRLNLQMALIGEGAALQTAQSSAASIYGGLAEGSGDGFGRPPIEVPAARVREGWSTATAVSFVARAFETVRLAHEDAPALAVISKVLRALYLHREIREKGGAYGGFAIYSPEDGLFSLGSYRDPHIVSTLRVYEGASEFICSGDLAEEDIKEAVLQVCSEIDKPDPPGPAAKKAFYRRLIALSDELRTQYKTQLLALTRPQVMAAAEKYFRANPQQAAIAVISSEEKLNAANAELSDCPLALHRI
ncbi:MAG: insulinase family protein [Desulfobacterales bacterium]|nr:MAG: insulinase family protein [Desulfobacterales bacterium]